MVTHTATPAPSVTMTFTAIAPGSPTATVTETGADPHGDAQCTLFNGISRRRPVDVPSRQVRHAMTAAPPDGDSAPSSTPTLTHTPTRTLTLTVTPA